MLVHSLINTLIFVSAVTASVFPAAIIPTKPNICREPYCTSFCPDGTPFDCCVVYVRDPCSDHQLPPKYPPIKKCTGPDDFECVCRCEKYPNITYLCNAQYFRDPCSLLPGEVVDAPATTSV